MAQRAEPLVFTLTGNLQLRNLQNTMLGNTGGFSYRSIYLGLKGQACFLVVAEGLLTLFQRQLQRKGETERERNLPSVGSFSKMSAMARAMPELCQGPRILFGCTTRVP